VGLHTPDLFSPLASLQPFNVEERSKMAMVGCSNVAGLQRDAQVARSTVPVSSNQYSYDNHIPTSPVLIVRM